MDGTKDKMRTMPVNKLMLSMGIPMILSMMLQAVYNIVDSAFVSNMKVNGEAALNALSLAFPLQVLLIAFGIGTGVGANALLSKSLGQQDREKAGMAAGNALFVTAVIYIIVLIFSFTGVDAYIGSQTENPLIAQMASDYLRICCMFSFGSLFFAIYEKVLQAAGHSLYSTIAQISGAVVNIILDPIFIYGIGPVPECGVKGAAYATVIGQIVSFVTALIFHLKINKAVPNGMKYIKPNLGIIKEIYAIGLPAVIAQALMSVMTYALNIILVNISEAMVTSYGLFYKIQQFILFAAFGLRDAITPVISFSHGMGSRSRINDGIKYGLIYTAVITLIGTVLIEALAVPLSAVFGLSGETQSICIDAMHIISISFVFAGINIAFQGVFQALDSGLESLIVSVCRQFIFVIPVAWGFSKLALSDSSLSWTVWTTFIIAEVLSDIISVVLFRRAYGKKAAVLSEE